MSAEPDSSNSRPATSPAISSAPTTTASPELVFEQFEKNLLGQPNSSLLWIKYMSTALKMVDLSRSRIIAERALTSISFRQEQEKMNLWLAYLNMENLYGTEESLRKIFERSCVYCDSKVMHLQMAKIFVNSGKHPQAEEAFQRLIKKFNQSCKSWTHYGEYLYERDIGRGRKLLGQALKSLPKRKHEKATLKFAQIEYKTGSVERARTLFEGILSNSPKRIDLWSIYVTMEENGCRKLAANGPDGEGGEKLENHIQYLRRLFERIVHLKLSSKKAKYFFKRFLEFEKQFGTASTVNHVKELARLYVESSLSK